jgi:hypothetical protein
VQYNNAGAFAGMSGTAWDDTNRSLTVSGATLTTSAPVIDLAQTWNSSGTTFTGVRFNAAGTSFANSSATSLLMDLQVGGVSRFYIQKSGYAVSAAGFVASAASFLAGVYIASNNEILALGGFSDAIISWKAAANLRFGNADAASPIAQTLSVQSVVSGTSNTAGQDFKITGSQGTGTGAGGSIVFQVAPAGGSGTAQNALQTALTIDSQKNVTIPSILYPSFLIVGAPGGEYSRTYAGQFTLNSSIPFAWTNSATSADSALRDLFLYRDAANTLAQRNGTAAQTFRAYNTYTDGSNYERGVFDWTTTANTLTIGMQKAGSGTARAISFVDGGGTERINIAAANGVVLLTGVEMVTSNAIAYFGASTGGFTFRYIGGTDSNLLFRFAGVSSSFPALKRSTTSLQARLADDSAFTNIQGKLTTDTAYTAGVVVPTGYITIYDSTGTAYRVPCLV